MEEERRRNENEGMRMKGGGNVMWDEKSRRCLNKETRREQKMEANMEVTRSNGKIMIEEN